MVETLAQDVTVLEREYLPSFIHRVFTRKPSKYRRVPAWRLRRAHFAGREARLRLLGWRGRLPIQPHIGAPPQAPGIHLVVRGLNPGVFSGTNWIELTGEQGNNVLIYSWLTELEAYEFCATVRGETASAKFFDYELVAQHKLQEQSADYDQSNSSIPQSATNPWAGID